MLQATLNGALTKQDHPAVPVSPDELALDAAACVAAGAEAIHLHPRDAGGRFSGGTQAGQHRGRDLHRGVVHLHRVDRWTRHRLMIPVRVTSLLVAILALPQQAATPGSQPLVPVLQPVKVRVMLEHAVDFDTIVTDSELEALILENNLIKE